MKIWKHVCINVLIIMCFIGVKEGFSFTSTSHWNSNSEAGWGCIDRSQGYHTLDGSTNTPDPSSALKMVYPAGFTNGAEPAMCWYMFPSQATEYWVQYYFKYSSNYYYHSVDNKQTYYFIGTGNSNFYLTVNGSRRVNMVTQTYVTDRHVSNTGYDPAVEPGRWYKMTAHFVMNSPGVSNGIAQVWLDDKLIINKNTVGFLSSSQAGQGVREMQISPVFGGMATMTKPAEDYQWYDHTIISTERQGSFPVLPIPVSSNKTGIPNPPMIITIN
ncbi:MAG: hypothetical protein IH588_20695 [Anaerolineales bacterium]|nr:hypothetical protein [Anaerolineales bacterium]